MFEPNPAGLDELLHGSEAGAHLTTVARAYKDEVERIAPQGHGSTHFGDTIEIGEATDDHGESMVTVETSDPFWHLIEFGSANNPPYRPFTAAAENVGLEFHDTGKP